MEYQKIRGIVAATVTPYLNEDENEVNYDAIEDLAKVIVKNEISVFVNGTTAEFASLTVEERKKIAEKWRQLIPRGSVSKVLVHVGSCCLKDSEELARHAQEIGVDGFGAVCPFYHKPKDVLTLVKTVKKIAEKAPNLPFYYYHFPGLTGVTFSMASFFNCAESLIPNLVGMKFTHTELGDLREVSTMRNGYYNILLGDDTALGAGLMAGADGAIGSTYIVPFMLPIFKGIVQAFNEGNIERVRNLQTMGIEFCRIYGGPGRVAIPHLKNVLQKNCGINVGSTRLPLPPLTEEEENTLEQNVQQFFTKYNISHRNGC
jgi:N-acetylneuraminate lyase